MPELHNPTEQTDELSQMLAHEHAGDSHDQAVEERELDPASRSLSDALKMAFSVLSVFMILLVVAFTFSGCFKVEQNQVALVLRFGAYRGEVLRPAGRPYFAMPEPIDTVVRINTSPRTVDLNQSFWFNQDPSDVRSLDQMPPGGPMVPGRDGYLITGDQNIVHGKFSVTYQVLYDPNDGKLSQSPVLFVQNVGIASAATDRPKPWRQLVDPMDRADDLVMRVAENAIVRLAAQMNAEDFISGRLVLRHAAPEEADGREYLRRVMQKHLDQIGSGISITGILLSQPTAPLAVRQDYNEVAKAEAEKGEKIEGARQNETKLLNQTAGQHYQQLLAAIDAYELARAKGDAKAVEAADEAVSQLMIAEGEGQTAGQVSQIIGDARTYRTQVVEKVRAEADQFSMLLPQYRTNPRIVMDRLLQDAKQVVLVGRNIESIYLPPAAKNLYLELSRDPDLARQRETDRYRKRAEGTQNWQELYDPTFEEQNKDE